MFRASLSCTPEEARLATFFDPSQPRTSFGDAEIEEVRLLLSRCRHYASKAPRTYIVLRYIDQLQVLHRLLEEEFGDWWFPIGKRSLPSFLDPRIKADIVKNQHIILTKSIDLERGVHCYLGAADDLPFNVISYIGSGSFGHVRKIESKVTFRPYALKTIRRQAAYGTRTREAMQEFHREMKIMRRLKHQHIVRYIGSYTDKKDLGLVMSPIAECDLAGYLHNTCTRPEHHPTLRTFYGCLATALAYLHANQIKHRDIKPQNILVHRASVLLTDFGLSHETLDTTYGGTRPGTIRYQSPEVAAFEKRNATADVWSLGCVFLEILTALHGHDLDWLRNYYEGIGTGLTHFHANPEATDHLLYKWRTTLASKYAKPLIWIKAMLVARRDARPGAEQVAAQITATDNDTGFMYSCDACCGAWSDSDLSSSWKEDAASQGSNLRAQRAADVPFPVAVFNQPLTAINEHAQCHIVHVTFLCGGTSYTCRRPVPVVFGKCIEYILSTESKCASTFIILYKEVNNSGWAC